MKVSVNWLKDYINIEDLSIKEISDKITLAGLEVEGIEVTEKVTGVVTAKVLSKNKHPNADKLNLCSVTDGIDTMEVVCGAPNVEVGQIVALAKLGAKLPEITIKPAKIRGIESCGMLCSEKELGITSDHQGIIVFPENTPIGSDINEILGLGDTILELNVTPNRPDWLSITGVAREIGAVFERETCIYFKKLNEINSNTSDNIFVNVKEVDKCPIYTLRIIKGIKVEPSPLWMQNRLKASGIRAINNVVDITNYILLEYGQPLHAFDIRKIKNGITVRNANNGEKITALDEKEYVLDNNMLVIADDEKAVAIAGVMGGEFSGIENDTDTVLLECAYFQPESIRNTSKKLSLSSDSSYRYERGIDWGKTEEISDYAAALIAEICGGEVYKSRVGGVFKKIEKNTVTSSVKGINKLLGTSISDEKMANILNKLSIKTSINGDNLVSDIPSFRVDISKEADIAEEVARIYGYDNIEATISVIKSDAELMTQQQKYHRAVRERLETLGFNEVVNFSFMFPNYLTLFDSEEKFIKILNPISSDMAWLRSFVFPAIIKNLQTNKNQGETVIRLFEISSSFISQGVDKLAIETPKLALGVMGSFMPESWIKRGDEDTFYYLKGALENIFSFMRLNCSYSPIENISFLHPKKSAEIICNNEKLGFIGCIHPDILEKLDIKHSVYIAEIDFSIACDLSIKNPYSYSKFSRFPSVERDLAVIIPNDLLAAPILQAIKEVSPVISDVSLFDIYDGSGIEDGYKSVAFRVTLSDITKTLSEQDINPIMENILQVLNNKFSAKLR